MIFAVQHMENLTFLTDYA